MKKSILLVGKPHSSKTVFLTQFYSRLQRKKSRLSLYQPIDDMSPIYDAQDALAKGDPPNPTPSEQHRKFNLPIQSHDEKIDLLCPEYGGEQVTKIIESRSLSKEWSESIEECDNWIVFIRPNSINKALDISDVTVTNQLTKNASEKFNHEYAISEQVFFIELLQILLHAKGNDLHFVNNSISLTVVLTCWDELNTDKKPTDFLKKALPLFLDFIKSNWHPEKLHILGLSAQGFSLDLPENKEKYQTLGPHNFGYIIMPDGTMENDITELIVQAIL